MGTRVQLPSHGRYIGIVGPGHDVEDHDYAIAREVGRLVATELRATVVCGGLDGVMKAACEGAELGGGLTVGLLPGFDRADGNEFLTVVVPTGLGELRNGLVVNASDALISIGGSWGTMAEVALALRTGKPVVSINGWTVQPRSESQAVAPLPALSAREAIAAIHRLQLWE
jgi:uncharacterized protein (TIGR00725 family)